jgi:hypothetical protein
MLFRALALVLAIFGCGTAAQASSTFAGLPQAAQPVGSIPDAVPLDQGSGCKFNTSPCTTVQTPSLRIGQPLAQNCLTIPSPFQYQECFNTTTSPAVLEVYVGTTWLPLAGVTGSVVGPGTTVVGDCVDWNSTTGNVLGDAGAPCLTAVNGIPSVTNNVALQALSPGQYGKVVRLGFSVPGDAPALLYNWAPSCPGAPDNGAYVAPGVGGSGCWVANFPATGDDVREWGTAPSGDMSSQLQACLTAATHGVCLAAPGYSMQISNVVTIPSYTTLTCGMTWKDAQGNAGQFAIIPALQLATTAPLTAGGIGATIDHCLIYRSGMTFPAPDSSAYSGTGVNDAGFSNFAMTSDIVMGFDTCVDLSGGRPNQKLDFYDCTGTTHASLYEHGGNTDSGFFDQLKLQPMATGNLCPSAGLRNGIGVYMGGLHFLNDIVSQNFTVAEFEITFPIVAKQLWADFNSAAGCPAGASIGLLLAGGGGASAQIEGYTMDGIYNGISAQGGVTSISNVNFFLNKGPCIVLGANGVNGGYLHIGSLAASSGDPNCVGPLAIYADSTNSTVLAIDSLRGAWINGGPAPPNPYFTSANSSTPIIGLNVKIGQLHTDLNPNTPGFSLFDSGYQEGMGADAEIRQIQPASCTFTGLGSTGTCGIQNNGSDEIDGFATLTPSGSGIASSGSATVTFSLMWRFGKKCTVSLAEGTGSWGTGASVAYGGAPTPPGNTAEFFWNNNGVALTSGDTYHIVYHCPPF